HLYHPCYHHLLNISSRSSKMQNIREKHTEIFNYLLKQFFKY
ncbi:hypothetical protein EHRUM3_09470, partial [Ehrlichia ruminantium]